jgi:hypothetical protein
VFSTIEEEIMEYFYDDYSGNTMLKAGIEDFTHWYGDKVYRQFDVVADIQREVVSAVIDELLLRIDKLTRDEYAIDQPGYREGVVEALWAVQGLFKEIDEKDLTPDDDSL